jgi:hypothetical protein
MPYVVPFDIFGLVFTFPLRPGLAIREFHTSFWAASLSTCHHERRIDRDTGQPSREFGPAIDAVQMRRLSSTLPELHLLHRRGFW